MLQRLRIPQTIPILPLPLRRRRPHMLEVLLVRAGLDNLEQDEDSPERQADLEATVEPLFVVLAALG